MIKIIIKKILKKNGLEKAKLFQIKIKKINKFN